MKKLTLILILVAIVAMTGCPATTSGALAKLPETAKAACAVYSSAKPEVIAARAWAKDHWNDKIPGTDTDLIPATVKGTLLRLDSYLPQLDSAGLVICSIAESTDALQLADGKKVDWDQVLATTLKAVSFAIDLKKTGAI